MEQHCSLRGSPSLVGIASALYFAPPDTYGTKSSTNYNINSCIYCVPFFALTRNKHILFLHNKWRAIARILRTVSLCESLPADRLANPTLQTQAPAVESSHGFWCTSRSLRDRCSKTHLAILTWHHNAYAHTHTHTHTHTPIHNSRRANHQLSRQNLIPRTDRMMKDLRFSRRWRWRIASSGMLRRVALVSNDVSEEFSAAIITVRIIGELGTLAVTSNGARYQEIQSELVVACVGC
jgi:hypothetical protein